MEIIGTQLYGRLRLKRVNSNRKKPDDNEIPPSERGTSSKFCKNIDRQ